jgi:uncharacterized protein
MTVKTIATVRSFFFLLVCPAILIVASLLTKKAPSPAGPALVGGIASCLTFVLTLLFVRWDGISLNDVGEGITTRTAPRLLSGFVIGVAMVALQDLIIYSGGHTRWAVDNSHPSTGATLLASTGYFALAVREELSFRGYPLRRLEEAWGTWTAILVLGVIFTLEHAAGGWGWRRVLVGPPLGALLFGVAALVTRGLAVPIGIHAAFNFSQWFMGQKESAGILRLVVERGFSDRAEALGYAGYCLGMVIAGSGFWLWRKHWLDGKSNSTEQID